MFKTNLIKKSFSLALTGVVLSALSLPFINTNNVLAVNPQMEFTNAVNKGEADRGETLSYTVTIKNTGDVDLTNVFVWINLPNLADYVSGSATYQGFPGGQLRNLTDAWVQDGVNLGTIPTGKYIVLKYQTKVAGNANHNDIVWSVASVKSDQTAQKQANSFTKVVLKNPSLCAEKLADKTTVEVGDEVTFTIRVCNRGNIVLHNVYIGDFIHPPLQYMPGTTTLKVDGEDSINITDAWIRDGVNIGPLNPEQSARLRFKVKVTSALKDGETIQNVAQVKSDETPQIIKCFVVLKGKVLGITQPPTEQPPTEQPPTELPNTGPGVLLALAGLAPVGYFIKKFKSKI